MLRAGIQDSADESAYSLLCLEWQKPRKMTPTPLPYATLPLAENVHKTNPIMLVLLGELVLLMRHEAENFLSLDRLAPGNSVPRSDRACMDYRRLTGSIFSPMNSEFTI